MLEKRKTKVNGVEIEGANYSEFAINYFSELVKQYKNKPNKDRLQSYINYFLKNFSYEKSELGDSWINNNRAFFKLLYEGKGDAKQLAQEFCLLAEIDREKVAKNYMDMFCGYYVYLDSGVEKKQYVVLYSDSKGVLRVLDFAKLLQLKKEERNNFSLVTIEYYFKNVKQAGVQLVDENNIVLTWFLTATNKELSYKNLMLAEDDIQKNKSFERFYKRTFTFKDIFKQTETKNNL